MRTRVAPIVVAVCLLAAACGGDDDGADTTTPDTEPAATTATTARATTTTSSSSSTTTTSLVVEGATVVVANSSIVSGAAGRMTDELAGAGFTMGPATNGTDRLEESVVYYTDAEGAEAVAESVGSVLGGVETGAMPDPIPTETGTLEGAQVLLLLGNEQADRTLQELSGGGEEETADTTGGTTAETAGATRGGPNDSGVDGAAGAMSEELEAAGFTVGTPTNGVEPRADSIVYYTDADGAQGDAEVLAEALGGVDIEPMPDEIPTESGELDGEVLLLLGTNEAGKSLDELSP
jgi:hypothetical protein